ncbi:MAG: hypothetical protein ACI9OJ_005410, partial [Myxococcota bacterium]
KTHFKPTRRGSCLKVAQRDGDQMGEGILIAEAFATAGAPSR